MIESIRGKLTEANPSKAIIEINGISYGLFIPLNNYAKLPPIGKEILLYVSTVIREDSQKSYGFLTRTERDLFEKLIDVSGIGPKTAVALIGHLEIADFHLAISQNNSVAISKVPGIGKKTAERLIIEFKDKLKNLDIHSTPNSLASDAINALINLGYAPILAQRAINSALKKSPDLSLPDLITQSLQLI